VGDQNAKVKDGKLADVAPSILSLMGISQPLEMTGENLIER
jgi:2,3-bisphosphoglycerate-independent phosphoglycerate mutase